MVWVMQCRITELERENASLKRELENLREQITKEKEEKMILMHHEVGERIKKIPQEEGFNDRLPAPPWSEVLDHVQSSASC